MMQRRAGFVVVGVVMAFVLSLSPSVSGGGQDVERDRFVGTFAAVGTGNLGNKYEGTVTIARVGDVYRVHWEIANGDSYDGVGIATGNVLSVGWQLKESAGVAVYEFTERKITGRWSVIGAETHYIEELTAK